MIRFSYKLSKEELQKQIDQYDSLKITDSYRKMSAVILLIFMVLSILSIDDSLSNLINIWIIPFILIIAFYVYSVYKGKEWIYQLISLGYAYSIFRAVFYDKDFMLLIIYLFIGYFYFICYYNAYRVEKLRKIQLSKK